MVFIGITVPDAFSVKLRELQQRVQMRLEKEYGYKISVTHGRTPPHITLVAPVDEANIDSRRVIDVAEQLSERTIVLDGVRSLDSHTIYLGLAPESYVGCTKLHDDLHHHLGLTPAIRSYVPHVGLARKFSEEVRTEQFSALYSTFVDVSADFPPLKFPADHLTLYRNEGDGWRKRGGFPFMAQYGA